MPRASTSQDYCSGLPEGLQPLPPPATPPSSAGQDENEVTVASSHESQWLLVPDGVNPVFRRCTRSRANWLSIPYISVSQDPSPPTLQTHFVASPEKQDGLRSSRLCTCVPVLLPLLTIPASPSHHQANFISFLRSQSKCHLLHEAFVRQADSAPTSMTDQRKVLLFICLHTSPGADWQA